MPTTRSRSRATKEPSAEELKEATKGIYEELDNIYKGNKLLVEALGKDIYNLYGWSKRHAYFHNRVRDKLDELDEPLPFRVKVWCFLSAVATTVYPPLLLLSAVVFLF